MPTRVDFPTLVLLALEHCSRGFLQESSASKAFASWRSAVSNPSVNQP
jgi:hypothetical protein